MSQKVKKPKLSTLSPEEYEKRLKRIILAGLGKAWMFWPVRAIVKRRCKDPNRPGWSICELCHKSVEKLDTDHIEPCVSPIAGFVTWDEYITRRFVFDAKKLQGICKDCHRQKSKIENAERRARKKKAIPEGNGFLPLCGHDDPSWCTDTCHRGKVVE